MASQILITTIISSLIIILALQLSEQKSIIIGYLHMIFSFICTVWDELLQKGGKMSCAIAQFGALILLRKLYTHILRPLYLITSTEGKALNLKQRYGSWGIIVGDLDRGDMKLMREFAKDFISKGMNVLILDCSLALEILDDEKNMSEREETMRNDFIKLFLEDLRQYSAENNNSGEVDKTVNDADKPMNDNLAVVDILDLKDDFCSKITFKLGDITTKGGIGILVHCFSSKQVSTKETSTYNSSCKGYGTEKFLSILNLTLPYMIFAGVGAIINVCRQDDSFDDDLLSTHESINQSYKARGVAECAFYTQLIRSLHYEYGQYGIDSLAVSLQNQKSFDAKIVVQSSLQILGEDYSELDMRICKLVGVLKSLGIRSERRKK